MSTIAHPAIAIGADHAGFQYKDRVVEWLRVQGYLVTDYGTDGPDSVDYPDFAHAVAAAVQAGQSPLGILICGSGNGVCMAANKHAGVRAALAWQPELAQLARTHNDANVLCLPARFVELDEALRIVEAFLIHAFEGGRHARRVEKIEKGD